MTQHNVKARSVLLKALILVVVLMVPAVTIASGGDAHTGSGVILKDFIYRCFSFFMMVGLLAYFLTKPVRKGLKGRREEIEKALASAQSAKEAAEAKHREYSEKLAKATEEIATITDSIHREGVLEREKILNAAKEMALKIEKEADNKALSVVAKARIELREEAARLAVELAENMLRKQISADDKKRLVDEYMQKVGELH